jgi:aminobenzoyl-glutamate utilization protein B
MEEGIEEMSMTLWDYSETALRETRSADYLASRLRGAGFQVTTGVAGMPTAFVAEYGSGRPIIGILAEYDALPGVGNAVVPERAPREDGHVHGQGCGHNLFGAASVGAAVALKQVMAEQGIQGTVRLYGTPAEETVVGKVYMAREGLFDDLDAALHWHPGLETETDSETSLAMNNFEVEFRGQAAHGAADPWNGRSALDAVELMNHGVNLMREHVQPSARIHYVIPGGGEAPNVVPEYARVWYFVRDRDRERVEEYYEWILKIAEGAAMATRTEHSVTLTTGVHAMLQNRPLQEAIQANLEQVGPPDFSQRDQEFAMALQRSLEIEEKGLMDSIMPLPDTVLPASGGSTDVAEVSRIAPTGGFSVTSAAAGIPWHSWATTASHGTPGAQKAAVVAAKVLALTGADLLTRPELVEAARADFMERMDGATYESPLPPEQAPPVPEEAGSEGG